MSFSNLVVETGKPLPHGADISGDGVNFSLFSRHATAVTLVLFETADSLVPAVELRLDPHKNRTGDVWHCLIRTLGAGTLYLYRVDGPYIPEKGYRFNPYKMLIDPYTKALTEHSQWDILAAMGYNPNMDASDLSFSYEDDAENHPKCVVIDDDFDWQGDRPINYPLRFSILYETHVRGLTAHKSSGVAHPGTYLGVIEKIPYLKELGVTGVEFLPVQEFNENELPRTNPRTGEPLRNFWGYSTVAFFAPKSSYAVSKELGGQVREFKEMVRELHKSGIEVILDIVFNHTAEGNELGPTFSFRGIDNTVYYMLDDNKRFYKNYSGCGNTLNCNHPVMRTFIIECLRYWVVEMHVDGFRFDLGSILGRDQQGHLMENPPVLERIAEDPVLRHTKIIAEAWDAGGAYQVGWFPGGRWAEWNDRYRDDIRKFWRGDMHQAQHFATRLSGSSDLYLRDGRKPFHSINFITSHDGFTLNDLVSYTEKHNEENGEENRDGGNANWSSNYGIEGLAANPTIEAIRSRQIKNMFATQLLSLGTPMILGGDEIRRTQYGNNNAYCQDNEVSWYDWNLLKREAGLFRFVKGLIAFRMKHPAFLRPEFFTGKDGNYNALPDITWYDEKGESPDWARCDKRLAFRLDGSKADTFADRDDNDFYVLFNAGADQCPFILAPPVEGTVWFRAIDTAKASPNDIVAPGSEKNIPTQKEYLLRGRSVVVLISKNI
ncbi:MAG: glycogen debranching protein GlgX [Treponemataceae bacterium]